MHKTLFLLRHAKSNHDEGSDDDFSRPLATKGLRDCTMMGQYLKQHQYIPGLVLISDAVRTTQTATNVLASVDPTIKIVPNHTLYLATAGEILKAIATVPDHILSLMIVAHHPGLQQLGMFLSGSISEANKDIYRYYPTTGLAIFDITADNWQHIDPSVAKLKDFVYP